METNLPTQHNPTPPKPTTFSKPLVLGFLSGAVVMGLLVYFYQQQKIDRMLIAFSDRGMIEQKNTVQNQTAIQNSSLAPVVITNEKKDFTKPYAVHWESLGNSFTLTGAEWGEYKITEEMALKGNWTRQVEKDEIVRLFVIKLKITTGKNTSSCVEQSLRMQVGEDIYAPLNRQFIFPDTRGCAAMPNTTYNDLSLFFEMPSNPETFDFTDGNISFRIRKTANGAVEAAITNYKNFSN